jgi:nucleotide-binding universal stress UspA family protein
VPANVVCGVDRSRPALAAARLAAELARRLGLRLEPIHVMSGGEERDLSRARSLHDDLRRDLDESDLALRLESGRVAERLRAAARQAVAIVVGTRGAGALRSALLGSVSGAVARDPNVPVIVVPSDAVDAAMATGGIVCGVQDSADVTVADAASRLADCLGLDLTLVHVVPPPRVPTSAAGGARPAMLPRRAVDETAAAREMLREVSRRASPNAGGHTRLRVLAGPVGPQLRRLAVLQDATLVAVGASERGALAAALSGSPSRRLMRRGSLPVMVCPRQPGRIT